MSRLLALLFLAGCARTPVDPAVEAAERLRRARCASIEIYPSGLNPSRPYRVVGAVQVTFAGSAPQRQRALADRACALGADAVIDVMDQQSTSGAGLADPGPRMGEESIVATGTAVAYTDQQ